MLQDFKKTAIVTATHEVSFTEMLLRINHFASLTPATKGERVVVFSENREGWIYAFYAIWLNGGIVVPVDAMSTADGLAYIVGDCTPVAVWTTNNLKQTVEEALSKAGVGAKILIIDEHEREQPANELGYFECDTDATALVIYTSGTTGQPKGVMLSFANLLANIEGVSLDVPIYNSERRTMILLPLHHVLPLLGSLLAPMYCGGGVALSPGMTAAEIMDTLQRGKVSIIIGVPRLWQNLYAGIKKQIDAHSLSRTMFRLCEKVNSRWLSRLVFSSVRKKMGGHVDFCCCGGASLDMDTWCGLRTLGLDVIEGYGLTETSPIISFTRPGDYVPGASGKPLTDVEVKLVDGEICAKGPNLMSGYYGKPKETAEAIDKDGFLHTGDLGRFDEEGRLYITGRKKELIVLSNGKNVQPVEVEHKLEAFDSMVKEAAVTQRGDVLCAIIVPQPDWASRLTDREVEERLKTEVLERYNAATETYKRVLDLVVWHEPLPRTRMEKLQRYRLHDIVEQAAKGVKPRETTKEPESPEYYIIKRYIEEEKRVTPRPTDHIETDLAFDSLDKVWLQGFIEQTFGARVNAADMGKFPSLAALVEHVAQEKTQMEVKKVDWHELLCTTESHLPLPSSTVFFPLSSSLLHATHRLYNRLEVKGRENIPEHGPYIMAPNHQSYVDGGVVMCGVKWSNVKNHYFYATEEHVSTPVAKYMARHSNVVVMERENLKDSILKLAQVLRDGHNIIIFPEGSRTHNGEVGAFKKTFAILAFELQVPIVPVCISGAFDALPRTSNVLRPRKITVEYLPPIVPRRDSTYDELTAMTRNAIVARLHK